MEKENRKKLRTRFNEEISIKMKTINAKEFQPDDEFVYARMNEMYEGRDDLECVVKALLRAKARGQNVYWDYVNIHAEHPDGRTAPTIRFYSLDITMDDAYRKVYNCTKAEFDKQKKQKQHCDDEMII